jgi:acyl-CoA synthetase (AMP-forming)/AMP-acid ligase II
MVDRYKDIVKTGGENVSSLRVEAVLAQHPDVTKAAVIGLPHPRWSEAVTAVVVLREVQAARLAHRPLHITMIPPVNAPMRAG